jgi:hypothetical protein
MANIARISSNCSIKYSYSSFVLTSVFAFHVTLLKMVLTCEICDELIRCEEMIKALFDKQIPRAASKRRRLKLIKPSSSAKLTDTRVSCNECQKLCKNRRSLSTHKSYYHRNKAANVEAKVETKVETKIEAKVNATTEQLQ